MRLVLAGLLLVVLSGCSGGGSPTEPSSGGQFDNLSQAPAGAHSISNADLTVRFWFEFNPPRNSNVAPGQNYSITFQCRRSALTEYGLVMRFEVVAPDGTALTGVLGDESIHTGACQGGASSTKTATIPDRPDFTGVAQIRTQAWLQFWQPGTTTTLPPRPPPVSGPPMATVTDTVNWTVSR